MSDSNSSSQPCPVDHTKLNTTEQHNSATLADKSWYQKLPSLFWADAGAASGTQLNGRDVGGVVCPVDPTKFTSKSIANANISSLEAEEKCPVDASAREEWLKKIKQAGGVVPHHPHVNNSNNNSNSAPRVTNASIYDVEEAAPAASAAPAALDAKSCSSTELPKEPVYKSTVNLPTEREISSIPRTGEKANWVYPSQKQFFEAMQRKHWNPEATDMKTVVPIHNAVNERAWRLIQWWEHGQGSDKCGGIKLTSFKGDSKKLTPRARWKLFLGYERPFDRHDWVVSRCGTEIEYVIDFYSGKQDPKSNVPSFYLDVRPKLNTIEGCRLRIAKALGF